MTEKILLVPVFLPLITGLITLLLIKKSFYLKEIFALLTTLVNLVVASQIFSKELTYTHVWAGSGIEFSLRLYHFNAFILLAAAAIVFSVTLYSTVFMQGKKQLNLFYFYLLLNLSFTNGAVLSDNLIVMLFFWEGLLLALFGFIGLGGKSSMKTAVKAFTIVGASDLCMMLGIALTVYLAKTSTISKIHLPLNSAETIGFIFLMIGAISKGGSMPFHSWIPDAATDAPLPFMAFIPAALEKLVGIYFLSRITMNMFEFKHGSWISILMMSIGAVTILLAVMMALIQKDYKRLLSFHAVSQVGYMILGIGTALPAGIIGGIFHMLNNAMYKSCLFLTAGAVEKQTGTTDLHKLGGLAKKMPVTFLCFFICALSISGVPPFNGFFSKELVYEGALESGWIFYAAALLGSFLTSASFLKLGHASYFGKLEENNKECKEVSFVMLLPMIVISFFCILFGVCNHLPINKIMESVLSPATKEGAHSFAGWPADAKLVFFTAGVLILAVLNHFYGVKKSGRGLGASDHIHYAPILHTMYDKAEKRWFDPYEIGIKLVNLIALIAWWIDRALDFIYNKVIVFFAYGTTNIIRRFHTGSHSTYLLWALVGLALMAAYLIKSWR